MIGFELRRKEDDGCGEGLKSPLQSVADPDGVESLQVKGIDYNIPAKRGSIR